MPPTKHDLLHEFPDSVDAIHALKMNNAHFAKLFEEYHDVDHAIHRVESGAEVSSDEYLESRKKQRLFLKDKLYEIIRAFEDDA
jgi:uncharacterized protein YdcH (DUF465 family)